MKKGLSLLLALLMVVSVFSPALPSFGGILASAASNYPVELAFENIFVFDHWASNQNSIRISSDAGGGTADGKITNLDVANGSFRITDTSSANTGNIYTTASMGTGDSAKENGAYYSMAVEAGATYTFSYNVSGTVGGFYPYVFFYDDSDEFHIEHLKVEAAAGYGANSYLFDVPEGMTHIQVRFTIPNADGNAYADVSNIAIYKVEMVPDETNLFDFDGWAAKVNNTTHGFYNKGTIATDTNAKSVTLTTNSAAAGDFLFTNFSYYPAMDQPGNNGSYYTVDVEPNTSYIFSYNLINGNLPVSTLYRPHIAYYDSTGSILTYLPYESPNFGANSFTFETPANTDFIQIIYALACDVQVGLTCTITNVELHNIPSPVAHKVDPTRKSYTYDSANNGTYGELPTPPANTIPEGYIFAGWYTGKDGTGIRIASDTPIQPQSYTVYPKFEPAVDSLSVVTYPSKTEYTKGEKLNTTGLVLQATIKGAGDTDGDGETDSPDTTFNVSSGYYYTPSQLDTVGTQTITVQYGGKTATFTVNVSNGDEKNITVNGATHPVTVANKEYILNYSTTPFNRYEMTYFSDSYVKGEITMDGITEVFFLEPSDNGSFASYIDSFLRGVSHYGIESIKFTCLDKDYGNFELLSVTTLNATVPSDPMQYYQNDEYKVGINLDFGGVVSYIEDLDDDVRARVYNENGNNITKVDYASNLSSSGVLQESTSVNLINTWDRGRYLQQSYYGTGSKPYNLGNYNGNPWNYNPVQGGNIKGDASKIIDYRITDDQIYIKTRPLDWGKWSEKYGTEYADEYITDSYMEAWYVFEDGMIKTYCRFVDYSGYPSNTTTQEMPALYTIEPLNNFVYNSTDDLWNDSKKTLENINEPEFWGILPDYYALLQANGIEKPNVDRVSVENWAAFTAGEDADKNFGIGVYSPGVTDMHFGTYPAIYNETEVTNNNILVANYRHAQTVDPAVEGPTSYISPVDVMTFESFKPTTYSYYITTGTANEIYEDFKRAASKDNADELAKTRIAVPETVYMTPADGASKVGQYYVNNVMDENNNYNVVTEAVRDAGMYLGLHMLDAKEFSVKITNVTDPSNDIFLCNTSGSEINESTKIPFGAAGTYIDKTQYGLRFSGAGLQPGEKATAKWEITVYYNDGSSESYTAYTVMYAPGRTVGAVAEARQVEASQHEISSWITGANGVDHSQRSPLGSFHGDKSASGYFKADPLYSEVPTGGSGESANDYINTATEYSENAYVLQTATNGHDSSRAQSYLGLLTVDKSRYTNTNQIPNLKIGYDVLRIGSMENNSLGEYTTYYILGNESAYTSTSLSEAPSGWTTYTGKYTDFAKDHSVPYREWIIPSFEVSKIDGQYIHALNQGKADRLASAVQYATAGTSVLCSVTDKSGLRESVLNGYDISDTYTDPEFVEALEKAATVLGDPSATQDEIDSAKKDLNNSMQEKVDTYYALKYDNIFSAYEFSQHPNSMKVVSDRGTVSYANGAITVVNDTITGGEAYTTYGSGEGNYLVELKPNTEYVFEYDVTTNLKAQAFMFFYNASGGAGDVPTNMSVKTNNGSWNAKSESNAWWGNYTNSAGTYHYAIKFTTGANTTKAAFRLGNTSNDPVTSTFSNIKLVDTAHYYEDAAYSRTEETFKEYSSYGAMITPTRPGYEFSGWQDVNGNTVTGADIATEHKTVYSQWDEAQYTVNYNANGGEGEAAAAIVKLTQQFTLPTNFAMDNRVFMGWSYEANGTAVFKPGQTITIADIQADKISSTNQVTLYAVWEKRYSVYFSQNGGTGEISPSNKAYSEDHILPDSTGITNYGYKFLGWALEPTATTPDYYPGNTFNVSKINAGYINEEKQEVILHAVWQKVDGVNVTFDNLVDISAWPKNASNGEVVNVTDTGFTVICNDDAGEGTCSSAYFPITAGHKYVIEADIKGDGWDVYVFFCDDNGNWVDFNDSTNRFASDGKNVAEFNGIHVKSNEFTAPAGATKVQLRVDANGSGNAVRFENIRAYDAAETTYLETVNKYVEFADPYGELPVPVKVGQVFRGWVDENGNAVTAEKLMEETDTVFLTSTWTTDANSISNDTVVVEYGMPVVIDVRANDESGATVNAIGVASIADDTLGHTGYPASKFAGTELDLANGNAVLNADGTITYTLDTTNVAAEEVFYYEVQIGGNYYYAKVTVIPATTLYFEDTLFKFADSTVTKNGVDYNYEWETVGASVEDKAQATDRPGPFNFEDDANNVYGYDSAKDGEAAFSGGTAHYTEVDQIAGAGGPTATFTFTGTGFDLFTVTDNKAGMFTATIYSGNKVDSTKRVKGVISNAYFGYNYDNDLSDYVTADNGAIYQVPILRERNLGYGTYTVVVQPRYNKSYDVANTGCSGVYVDSVRIFNPMGTDNAVANNAYKADGEYAPQYLEIRDTLVTPKVENGIYTGEYDFSVLENNKSVFLDGGRTSLADFAKIGPKNEVYLQAGDAVAFDIVTNSSVLPSTVQLGMGLTGKGGNTATVTLMNVNYNGWKEDITLNSTAERYYNIESVVDWVLQADGTYKTASPVIITNTSGGIIALTSLKWAFNQDIATTKLMLLADEQTPVLAMAAINRMNNPEPDNTVIAKDNIAYSFSSDSYAIGETGTLTISTEHGVAGVTVNGADVVNCEAVENGKLNWTFEFTADVAGEATYEIVVRDEAGNESETIYAITTVEDDSEATEPDDGIVDDGENDDTTNNVGSGNLTPDSFVNNLLNGIFSILMKLFSLFVGGATV